MFIKGKIKSGEYFDSVSLMIVSKKINEIDGVIDSSVVMGTKENQGILKAANFLLKEFESASDNDLLIVVSAKSEQIAQNVLDNIDSHLKSLKKKSGGNQSYKPKTIDGAIDIMPNANIAIISVAGKYASIEADKALDKNLHVMLFSDNISVEEEIRLKQKAASKNLLVMGPDCGTAIINGVPLAFANVVSRGDIGVVAASGTGLQEVTCLISNLGAGISQAIGTGGRDIKKEVGGIMMIEAIKALNLDPNTKKILIISKPPHPEVLEKIGQEVKKITKPVYATFLGATPDSYAQYGIKGFETLQEACEQITSKKLETIKSDAIISEITKKKTSAQKYVRALYSGGTFCYETQLLLKSSVKDLYSNACAKGVNELSDIWKSQKNTIIDLGEDEFTRGKPHPMIDFSIRNKRLLDEAADPETLLILLDVVLGHGSNMGPASELVPIINKIKSSRYLPIICYVCGTELDPQKKNEVCLKLQEAGAILVNSNAQMAELTKQIMAKV